MPLSSGRSGRTFARSTTIPAAASFARIVALEVNPRPPGARKLRGESELWRVRVGDYRILYSIEEARLVVLVVKIGHRREVYRGER